MSYFQFIVLSDLKNTYLKTSQRVLEQHNGAFSNAYGDWRAGRTSWPVDEEAKAPRGEVNCV